MLKALVMDVSHRFSFGLCLERSEEPVPAIDQQFHVQLHPCHRGRVRVFGQVEGCCVRYVAR